MASVYVLSPSVFLKPCISKLSLLRSLITCKPSKRNRLLAYQHHFSAHLPTLEITKPTPPPSMNAEIQQPIPTSAYVHLPFCKKRCFYCDFPIVALGTGDSPPHPQGPQHDPRMENYTNLICKEISAVGSVASDYRPPLETVFFGGGTPSLIPATLLLDIIECLRLQFGITPNSEISIEMDPGTFNSETLRQFMDLGINRVSLGVQAFQENLLRSCGRSHGLKEVYEAIEIVRSSGLQNWSLDLISSLPHQTLENWEHSLQEAINSGPAHVSIYDLQVEKGTKFGLLYKIGQSPLPNEDDSAEFYRLGSRTLQGAGYEHYEISNYAKQGFQCRHNMVYWKNLPYYGFGLGAASYVGGLRFSRPLRMKEYTVFVDNLEASKDIGRGNESEVCDSRDVAMDTLMLSLRLATGLDIKMFARVFGWSLCLSLCRELKPFVASGHLIVLDNKRQPLSAEVFDLFCGETRQEMFLPSRFVQQNLDEGGEVFNDGQHGLVGKSSVSAIRNRVSFIRLSDPEGFLLSNEVISTAFAGISE